MSGNSSNLNLNATNQQNIVLNQQNLINRGNIIVNQTQNTQNLILNQTNIMQNSQNIILNHTSPQNIVLNQNNLLSRPPSVQNQKQSPLHPSPCQSPYQIFNTNATMVGSNNLSLISNFPQSSGGFASNFHQQSSVLQSNSGVNPCMQNKNMSPSLNIVSNMSTNLQANISSNLVANQSITSQIGAKLNQSMTITSNNMGNTGNSASTFNSNYSNPSPISNPINSPYSNQILSPSNSVSSVSNMKSPVQSPSPILRPTTPQPIIQQTYQQIPVMTSGPNHQLVQIIHTPNNGATYQNHHLLGRQQIIAPTTHIQSNTSSIVKIKQPLNILPKPPSTTNPNGNGGSKNNNRSNHNQNGSQANNSAQIVLPNQALLPQGQTGTLVLNQMPLLVQQNTPQGIQLVLRPGTPGNAQITNQRTAQNLILQQNNASQPTVLIQHSSRPTTIQQPQQLVRVLTANSMIQHVAPTFIAMNGQPLNLQQLSQQKGPSPQLISNQNHQNLNIQAQNMAALSACIPNLNQITQQLMQQSQQQQQPMSVSSNAGNLVHQNTQHITTVNALNVAATAGHQGITSNNSSTNATHVINAVATNTSNVANALQQSNVSVLPGGASTHLSSMTLPNVKDDNSNIHVNSNVSNITTSTMTVLPPPKKKPKKKKKNKETKLDLANLMKLSGIGDDDDVYLESDASDSSSTLSASHHNPIVSMAEPKTFTQQPTMSPAPKTPSPCVITTPKQSPSLQNQMIDAQVWTNQLFTPVLNQNNARKLRPEEFSLSQNDISNLMSFPSQIGSIQISAITDGNISNKNLQKTPHLVVANNATSHPQHIIQQQQQTYTTARATNSPQVQNLNIPSQIGNIQISQICPSSDSGSNVVQNTAQVVNSNMLPHNQQSIIVQHGANTGASQVHNVGPSIGSLNLAQAAPNSGPPPQSPLGGFKLAMAEDGRILLQHDPTLHQDLQSQMLLQQIFGLNMVQPNIVFTSNAPVSLPQNISSQSHVTTFTQPQKPIENFQHKLHNTNAVVAGNITKTINSIQNTVATPKIENSGQLIFNEPLVLAPSSINGQLMLSLSAEQLEQLKNNPQFSVNGGPTLVFNNANNISSQNTTTKTTMNPTVVNVNNKNTNSVLVQHLNAKMPLKTTNENVYANQIQKPQVTSPKAVGKITKKPNKNITSPIITNNSNIKTPKSVKTALQDHLHIKNTQFTTVSSCSSNISPQFIQVSQANTSKTNLTLVNSKCQGNASSNIKTVPNVATTMPTSVTNTSYSKDSSTVSQNSMPPLIAVSLPKSVESMVQTSPTVMSAGLNMPQLVPLPTSNIMANAGIGGTQPGVFQRVQTIQLTSQKQQQLKNVQLQIQALSSRLQNKALSENANKTAENAQKNNESSNIMTDAEIHIALQRLFHEQQKILATGKLLPNMTAQAVPVYSNANCISESGPNMVTNTASKQTNANQFISNLLQQHSNIPRPQNSIQQSSLPTQNTPKVYYHHLGNQIIQVSPNQNQPVTSNHAVVSNQKITATSISGATIVTSSTSEVTKTSTSSSTVIGNYQTAKNVASLGQTPIPDKCPQQAGTQDTATTFFTQTTIPVSGVCTTTNAKSNLMSPNSRCVKRPSNVVTRSTIPRSVLIEQQLSMDQTEAANPDINLPFTSKVDACKRLVRYHCFNQPVLSLKDLDKADEIFELTARHFIDKFYNMVNKYKSLRLMESMQEVPTSELMMVDRMFIAGEQQELEKLRAEKLQRDLEGTGCDISIANLIKHENMGAAHGHGLQRPIQTDYKVDTKSGVHLELKSNGTIKQEQLEQKIKCETTDNTEYDEWLCIQKELGYVSDKTKTEVKVEARSEDYDIESNIKSFQIRSSNETKRALTETERGNESAKRPCTMLNETDRNSDSVKRTCTTFNDAERGTDVKRICPPYTDTDRCIDSAKRVCSTFNDTDRSNESAKRVCTTDSREKMKDIHSNKPISTKMAVLETNSSTKVETVSGVDIKSAPVATETSTNNKPVNSENEVFRTQTSFKKTLISVSTNLTSHSISTSSVSQSKLSICQNTLASHHDIDLELELGLDQFGGLNLLKTTHLDSFDENIDAQVQSAIDSILNLQQSQDGSIINMNTILPSNPQGAAGEETDRMINDLLGVSSGGAKKSNDLGRRASRAEKADQQLYEDLTDDKSVYKVAAKADMDSFSECSSPDDALDQAVRSILS